MGWRARVHEYASALLDRGARVEFATHDEPALERFLQEVAPKAPDRCEIQTEDMGALGRDFSSKEQRIGPLPPGSYTVTAVLDDGRSAKKTVKLTGRAERKVKLRAR